ncbi:MAG: putative methyltransferase YeeA [Streptosporangiaceae bacterium]|nr:putative methyltransferase YeeA [Streptosporangiaceae bacterium]
MFQAVVNPHERSNLGQHYTSVPNILKTIEPLFLDGLREQFDAGFDSVRKLEALLDRVSKIKVFDPACGSGNFLVIAYKELRKLEHAILERLADLDPKHQVLFAESKISIENFYGIELADFATEVAILSLWIAKHQMNTEFKDKFNVSIPLIPLKETGQIQQGNATRVDWSTVCPNDGGEIYLISNPPYAGVKEQTKDQKADFAPVFGSRPFSKKLDYVSLWFVKAADYIEDTIAQAAFVSTKSITQGEQVGLMFPAIFAMGIEIGYAYTPFNWSNNAKRNAGVTVIVVSLRNSSTAKKFLYQSDLQIETSNINGYLTEGGNVFVMPRSKPLSQLPLMTFGSKGADWGNLMLDSAERDSLLNTAPDAARFIRRILGTDEFVNDQEKWCLWIEDSDASVAWRIPVLARRFESVAEKRSASSDVATRKDSATPYRFQARRFKPTESIIFPKVSSSRREYIPVGYLGAGAVINVSAFAIYDAQPWVLALLISRTHIAWTGAVGGRMREDYQYSNTIVYNNFPVPPLADAVKEKLTVAALRVLDVREYHCEKTLAELYDPDLMPEDLRAAHKEVDALVDSIYSKRDYETDEQRLSDLFSMYEVMTAEEAAKAPAKNTRSARK